MDFKSFAISDVDNAVYNQGIKVAQSIAYDGCKIRLMVDGHVGASGPIGFTCEFKDKIVPATVGVDIACRVSGFRIGGAGVDLNYLDQVCREVIPTGFSVRNTEAEISKRFAYEDLKCWDALVNHDRLRRSMGTLGGGNHYVELDYDDTRKEYWFVIHSGSRNLGKQVAEYYQNLAVEARVKRIEHYQEWKEDALRVIRKMYDGDDISEETLKQQINFIFEEFAAKIKSEPENDLCYIEGDVMEDYLHDMRICNLFSYYSHQVMYQEVAQKMGWSLTPEVISCIHNYIDVDNHMIRKGAIEGYAGQRGLIPLNMRDGILIVEALGNEDWNCSLPHGAGRLMSRGIARASLSMEDFAAAMEGIVSSSVTIDTIDEAPMAYKDSAAIIEAIAPNAKIVAHMLPVFNFKAL